MEHSAGPDGSEGAPAPTDVALEVQATGVMLRIAVGALLDIACLEEEPIDEAPDRRAARALQEVWAVARERLANCPDLPDLLT